jgi:hypothetical protein
MRFFRYAIVFLNVIISTQSFSQDVDLPRKIQKNLSDFYSNETPLKIYLDFNQPAYSRGDTAFFKAYIIEAKGQPAMTSKFTLSTTVLNSQSKPVMLNRTQLNNGFGQGQLIVPDDCASGEYVILAAIDGQFESRPNEYFKSSFFVAGERLPAKYGRPGNVMLFPEGGSLIEGISGKVVVTGLNDNDSVYVRADNGQTLQAFRSSAGIGSFSLTASPGRSFFLETNKSKTPLDFIKKDGVSLTIQENIQGQPQVELRVNDNSHLRKEEFFLILNSHDQICKVIPISFDESSTLTFSLVSKFCFSGIGQATLFSKSGEVIAERLFALKQPETKVKILVDKQSVEAREKIKADIAITDDQGSLLSGNASVSVYKNNFFADKNGARQFSNYVLMAGDIVSPNGYDLNLGNYSVKQVDHILIASRNKTFQWKDIINYVPRKKTPEGPVFFKGRLVDRDNKPVRDSTYITFWLNENDFIYGVYTTGGNGNFSFPLFKNFTDDQALFVASYKGKVVKDVRIQYGIKLQVEEMESGRSLDGNKDPYFSFSQIKQLATASFSYFLNKPSGSKGSAKKVRDYIDTDFTVDVQKFKPFESVKELLGEVVPMVKVKKNQGNDEVRVFIQGTSRFATSSPLLLIDGVLTDSIDYFLGMVPSEILTIGVIHTLNELGRYGLLGKNGILVVTTRSSEASHLALKSSGTIDVKGIDKPIPFKEKKYSSAARSRIPDLRSTLYWNPGLKIDTRGKAQFEFYAADGIGEYVIRIAGITNEGLPFESYQTVNVSPSQSN